MSRDPRISAPAASWQPTAQPLPSCLWNHPHPDMGWGLSGPGTLPRIPPSGFGEATKDVSGEESPAKKRKKNNQELGLESDSAGQAAGKEDYVHVRARRGQATNSHSLAERVRRERISERMKYLQDLVPGCSKVAGKAVMLDEIINYVQSLQRQVELLSMKLATVNPSIDLNIEGLLSKDLSLQQLLQSQCGPSTMGFSQELILSQLLPSQQCFVGTGIHGIGDQSDALRRAINAQFATVNGFKEPATQIPNQWEAEMNNIVRMAYGTKCQDKYQM